MKIMWRMLLAALLLGCATGRLCAADATCPVDTDEPDATQDGWSPAMQEYLARTGALPPPADADLTRALAASVPADKDFGGAHEEPRWHWDWRFHDTADKKDPPRESPFLKSLYKWLASLSQLFGTLGHVLLWLLLLALLVIIWRKRAALLALLPARQPPAEIIAGIDIAPLLAPDALPDDVIAAARHLWQQGHARDALGLLYRAALHRLGARLGFAIPSSGTEQECQRLVQRHADARTAAAFRQLVNAWSRCAYAGEQPRDIDSLLDDYRATVASGATITVTVTSVATSTGRAS